MFNEKNLEQMDKEILGEISDMVHNTVPMTQNKWKYEPPVTENVELPKFLGGKVELVEGVLIFETMNMEYYLEDNELYIDGEEIELNGKLKPKNKDSKKLFKGLNKSSLKDGAFFKEFKEYINGVKNLNSVSIPNLIYNMVEVVETGIKTNDLIQAVKNLLMDAELQKTYNGYVMPLKNNICKPIRNNEIYEFIEDICNIRGISSESVKGALSYFNREAEPTFNCIVTANGYYDFNKGGFFEESDEPIVIKKASPYNYREELIGTTPPELLNNFLYETFSDDLDKVNQLLEIYGYMITDGNPHQIMPFFSGKGRNGKGVCLDLLSKLVDDNISTVDIFSVEFGSKYSSPLVESDINIINEVKNIKNISEVKEYLGQGGLQLARIYEQGRRYEDIELPKTILATNNFKGLEKGLDYPMMRRLRVFIEFNNIVPSEKQNPFILKELVEEEDSMDWILTNSIYLYQQIKNAGVKGKFGAEHSEVEISEHLEKYINPVLYTIKELYKYDYSAWDEIVFNGDRIGNWGRFVSVNDVLEDLRELNPETRITLNKQNVIKCIIKAFDLMQVKYDVDDYEGFYFTSKIVNVESGESKNLIYGVLRC